MPRSLSTLLSSPEQAAAEEASPATIPLLKLLSVADPCVKSVQFCDPSVKHVSKIQAEGKNFCGYRNVQMQFSYLSNFTLSVLEPMDSIPSISKVQELIEDAWDKGINPEGRIQTGGVRGTRKHIGTQEASIVL